MKVGMLCAGLLLVHQAAGAEIYKWVDDRGATHFSDDRPAAGNVVVVTPVTTTFPGNSYRNADIQESSESVSFNYYVISPAAPRDISGELARNTPVSIEGRKYRGMTRWRIQWNYTYRQGDGQCFIATARTVLTVIFTMPRLSTWSNAIPAVREPFDKYYTALLAHESGHKESGRLAAREITHRLPQLPGSTNCDAAARNANAEALAIIARYNQRDKDYDATTRHGISQGATIEKYL